MSYVRDYANVVRYSLLPHNEIQPFMDAHYENPKDQTSLHALADKFSDSDDPRGAVINRHQGRDSHPETEFWAKATKDRFLMDSKGRRLAAVSVRQGDAHEGGRSNLTFEPVAGIGSTEKEANVRKKAVEVGWDHFNIDTASGGFKLKTTPIYKGLFTEEEARSMANQLPQEHAEQVHNMLDEHFGKAAKTPE